MIKYGCGCEFNTNEDGKIVLTTSDIENFREDCSYTWDLLRSGKTRGIFQLEKNLGRKWSKEIKPNSIEELAAILSLIRPGCLKAVTNKKSMTQWYADRKNGYEEVEYLHPALEEILAPTFGVLTFQEQSIRIAQKICGFNLKQSDILRKAIGKKKADLMAQVKKDWMEGAAKVNIVNMEEAEQIYEWVKKSERYSFNKAHAVGYATLSYWTAYSKAHFPKHFFCAFLQFAIKKPKPQEEIKELVNDSHLFDIEVGAPDFRDCKSDFYIKEGEIRFGLGNIKSIGPALIKKIEEFQSELDLTIEDMSWVDFLNIWSNILTKTAMENLINCGALDFFNMTRRLMCFEYEKYRGLTKKEQEWCSEHKRIDNDKLSSLITSLAKPKKEGGGAANKNRVTKAKALVSSLENPPFKLVDKRETIIEEEDRLLGIPITYTKIDKTSNYPVNITCREIIDGQAMAKIVIGVVIDTVRIHIIKSGPNEGLEMAFLSVSDHTGQLDNVVVFTNKYMDYEEFLKEKNGVLIVGDYQAGKDSLVVQKVIQL